MTGHRQLREGVGVPPAQMQPGTGFALQVRTRRSSSLAGFPLQSVTQEMQAEVFLMSANVDKGFNISTGSFATEARREAQSDGALPIVLIDGDDLATKLKGLKLGVEVRPVEEVQITPEWFNNI